MNLDKLFTYKILILLIIFFNFNTYASQKPNVILIMTDDQGYGDLGFNGNKAIYTPNLDKLSKDSIHLDNFHVDPTCAPTRAALMTGRYSARCGVWHTVQGRNMLRSREITMANIFQDNKYSTGIFGKWHLGDNYPYRPEDRGFDHCVYHMAGGVGQAPDYWGNDYFDDHYVMNGQIKPFKGFCTDIWFSEAEKFIQENQKNNKPFFAYITPNAPHGPFYCPEEYTIPYEDNPNVSRVEFYGMVSNIDKNIGDLLQLLEDLKIADNTILIFTTDNGTAGGMYRNRGYNAGMRGTKNSVYEGGHRVPFLMRWPNGNLDSYKKVTALTAHLDILPTLIDLCRLKAPKIDFDGKNISNILYSSEDTSLNRSLVVESQRIKYPKKWRKCAVMTDQWRLIDGIELYDIKKDPSQKLDISKEYPEIVEKLRNDYQIFWDDVSREHQITSHIMIGSDKSPIVKLSSHDWLIDKSPPWNQVHVIDGKVAEISYWALNVAKSGEYQISLRRWPVEANKGINDDTYGKSFKYHTAQLSIGKTTQTKKIPIDAKEITFTVNLKKGLINLSPTFISDQIEATPYYVYITHKPFKNWQTPRGMNVPVYSPNYGKIPPQISKN